MPLGEGMWRGAIVTRVEIFQVQRAQVTSLRECLDLKDAAWDRLWPEVEVGVAKCIFPSPAGRGSTTSKTLLLLLLVGAPK